MVAGDCVDTRTCGTHNPGMALRFRVLIEQDEDGVFVVECPSLPGCVSQGKTRTEALANIRDAIQGYIASLEKHGEPIPPAISEEVLEVESS
jgi:predicted RNase H-like HicB family nuclease